MDEEGSVSATLAVVVGTTTLEDEALAETARGLHVRALRLRTRRWRRWMASAEGWAETDDARTRRATSDLKTNIMKSIARLNESWWRKERWLHENTDWREREEENRHSRLSAREGECQGQAEQEIDRRVLLLPQALRRHCADC